VLTKKAPKVKHPEIPTGIKTRKRRKQTLFRAEEAKNTGRAFKKRPLQILGREPKKKKGAEKKIGPAKFWGE